MNFKQILETAKVTAATLVYLASSPSRLKAEEMKTEKTATGITLTWTPSPETGVKTYVVAYGPGVGSPQDQGDRDGADGEAALRFPAGTQVAVKAINARGLEGWDWARIVIQ
jgi:hypothetical protein